MASNRRYTFLFLSVGLLMFAAKVHADLNIDHRFSGFATLGVVTNDNDELAFRRDVTQDDGPSDGDIDWKTDSLIGVQWQGLFSHQFDATVQLVAKERYENNLENSVEWAFIRYRPVDGLDVRLGRLGSDIFMLSDYRQVGYAFPWVRPPQDYYGLLSLYHVDGADINKRFDFSKGTLNVKVFYGNSDKMYPSTDSPDGVNLDFDPAGITFNLEWERWKWRYTYSDVHINNNMVAPLTDVLYSVEMLWPEARQLADEARTDGKSLIYNEFGVAYDNNTWWVQSEATLLSSDTTTIPDSRHFYLSIGRRFDTLSVYALYGQAKNTEDAVAASAPPYPSPIGEALAGLAYATNIGLNGARIKQNSYGMGMRWDYASKRALKFQVERYAIDQGGTNLWYRLRPTPLLSGDQEATVISLSMDVLF